MVDYDKYGASQDCWSDVGDENSNFVYKFM